MSLNDIAMITMGGAHREPVTYQQIAQTDTERKKDTHGRRCGGTCCVLPRPRGPITAELMAVRARLDHIAGRAAIVVLPGSDLRTVITGGAL